nr:hypothetical protein CFP56_60491 [Quercus suber]
MVIQDSCGEIMGAMSVRVPLPQTVTEVEVLACRHAVSFAIELGLHKVTMEEIGTVAARQRRSCKLGDDEHKVSRWVMVEIGTVGKDDGFPWLG